MDNTEQRLAADEEGDAQEEEQSGLKQYNRPVLIKLGSMRSATLAGSTGTPDVGNGLGRNW